MGDKSSDLDINKETNKVNEGNVDKVKKDEEDKTKDISMGTNEGDKVEDKPGNKLDGENSLVKDNDNIKVDSNEIDMESNKVDDSKVKEKGSGEIENKEGNKVIDVKVGQKEQNSEIK